MGGGIGSWLLFRAGDLIVEVVHNLRDEPSDTPDKLWGLSWRVQNIEAAHARLKANAFDISEIRPGRKPGTRVFTVRNNTLGVPTLIVARTDADSAKLLTSDIDPVDKPFCTGERTVEGFFRTKNGLEQSISRGLAYAEYADLIWCETGKPDLAFAKAFADAIHAKFPGKLLAYNCSPSFNWKKNLDDATIAKFQRELGAMGYKFQFITLAGFHSLNYSMFDLAYGYAREQMKAYVELQEREFAAEERGYTATKHQREVGAGYFDDVAQVVAGGSASTTALDGSTEEAQFTK